MHDAKITGVWEGVEFDRPRRTYYRVHHCRSSLNISDIGHGVISLVSIGQVGIPIHCQIDCHRVRLYRC